jgi:hypothetical protein
MRGGVYMYDDDWGAHEDVDMGAEAEGEVGGANISGAFDKHGGDALLADVLAEFHRGVRKTWTVLLVTKGYYDALDSDCSANVCNVLLAWIQG